MSDDHTPVQANTAEPVRPGVNAPLPPWVTIVVILGVLGLLVFNVVKYGPEGQGATMVLGGLLGAYAGLQERLRRKGGGSE